VVSAVTLFENSSLIIFAAGLSDKRKILQYAKCLNASILHKNAMLRTSKIIKPICDWLCKKGSYTVVADPNSTYLEKHNYICEIGTTLKVGPNIPLTYVALLVGVI